MKREIREVARDPHNGMSWIEMTARRQKGFAMLSRGESPSFVAKALGVSLPSACRWRDKRLSGSDGAGFTPTEKLQGAIVGHTHIEIPPLCPADEKRFWNFIDRQGPDDCWPWTSNSLKFGHGLFKVKVHGRWVNLIASRVALSLHLKADFIQALDVLHSCDNPPCCNFRHLRNGTAEDNAKDCRERHRLTARPAVLFPEQVEAIRKQRSAGVSLRKIAAQFGVAHGTIRRVTL